MSTTITPLDFEPFGRELTGYCYRYFASHAEAEDAVQETFTRAWQHADSFEGRSTTRTWLYKIATNVCLDMRKAPQRRALPTDLTGPGRVPDDPSSLTTAPGEEWVGPIGTDLLLADPDDPAALATMRDSVRLAFLSALQRLPPQQRVVLLLRDVLAFSAAETAEVLDTSLAAVTSALARARRTIKTTEQPAAATARLNLDEEAALLSQYVDAFTAYDVDRLVALLVEDATFSMPPFELWLQGRENIEEWWRGPGTVCIGSRIMAASVNALPGVAVYHPVGDGTFRPFAVHALTTADGRITGITHFMGAEVFAELGLPKEMSG